MKHHFLLLAVLATCGAARANDSAFSGVSGTPKPMKGEHHSVAMQSEKIVVVAGEKFYDTTVDFIFRNDGAATEVQMGFPETSYGDVVPAKKSAFLSFNTWVDGQRTPARRILTTLSEGTTEAYWLKTVRFAPKQQRRVRVSYRSPWGGNVEWGTRRALNYNFTGQNWKGKVERSDLEVRVAEPGLYIALPLFDNAPLPMELSANPARAVFRKTWRNWQAQGTFTFGLTQTVPFWMLDRGALSSAMVTPATLKKAVTFRVGKVPDALPVGADTPPAFIRNGTTYVSLPHLKTRLSEWTNDIDLRWNAPACLATLRVGAKSLQFSPQTAQGGKILPAILLRGAYDSTLYVPLATTTKNLGLAFEIDAKNRLFDIKRCTWPGN